MTKMRVFMCCVYKHVDVGNNKSACLAHSYNILSRFHYSIHYISSAGGCAPTFVASPALSNAFFPHSIQCSSVCMQCSFVYLWRSLFEFILGIFSEFCIVCYTIVVTKSTHHYQTLRQFSVRSAIAIQSSQCNVSYSRFCASAIRIDAGMYIIFFTQQCKCRKSMIFSCRACLIIFLLSSEWFNLPHNIWSRRKKQYYNNTPYW